MPKKRDTFTEPGLGPERWPTWAREAAEERAAVVEAEAEVERADAERRAVAEVGALLKGA